MTDNETAAHPDPPVPAPSVGPTDKPTTPKRIRLSRAKGYRKPPGSVVVARPSKWGNPFALNTWMGLVREPAALETGAPWEYEGRISGDGTRHDYFHPDGRVTVCRVRYMTREEAVESFRRLLTGDLSPSMRSAGLRPGFPLKVTVEDVQRELRGKDLACWCPLHLPCHADVLLEIANAARPVSAPVGGGQP